MACMKKETARPIPTDYAIPLPPAQGDDDAPPSYAGDMPIDPIDNIGLGSGGTVRTMDPIVVAQPYRDPSIPIDPPSSDVPDAYLAPDPWGLDALRVTDTTKQSQNGGTTIPTDPQLPVKVDPVVFSPAPMPDPQFPVPTVQEMVLASPPQIDTSFPVPTRATDPEEFAPVDPPVLYASDPPAPIDNWTATNADETECPPDDQGGVELYLG